MERGGPAAVALVALLAAACGDDREAALRETWNAGRDAVLARDYDAVWSNLARETTAKVEEQRQRIARQTQGSESEREAVAELLARFDMAPEGIAGMSAREYFVAMFQGMDRGLPEARDEQREETRGARIDRIEKGERKWTVHWLTTSGETRSEKWVFEEGSWKLVADVP